jgi:hypothetical protein
VELLQRPHPSWPIARFNRLLAGKSWKIEELTELASLPGLADSWRKMAGAAATCTRPHSHQARLPLSLMPGRSATAALRPIVAIEPRLR